MGEPVDYQHGHFGVAEYAGSLREAQVGDDHIGVFIQLGAHV